MDYRSLVNKLEAIQAGTYISEATAPTQFKPTHFHKGNLGNKNPVMQTPDGAFWHEASQGGEGDVGYTIVPWQGNTLNRSGWNPASIDGVITPDGKYIDFPEGVNWKQYKETADSDAALMAELKKLMELIEKYNALRAKRKQGGTPVAEHINFKGSIAQSLVESFGYNLYERVDLDPPAPGFLQTRLNVAAPNTPTFDPNQRYRDAYARQDTASNAKAYSDAEQKMLQQQRTAQANAPKNFSQTGSIKGGSYNVPTSNVPNMPSYSTGAPTTAGVASTASVANTASHTTPAVTTGAKATAGAGSKMLGAGSKLLGRAMPGVGAYMGVSNAIDSYKKGDYLGAALNGLSGAFSLVPGLGWIPAVGLGAWQAGRELSGATDKYDKPEGSADTPPVKPQSGNTTPPVKNDKPNAQGSNPNAPAGGGIGPFDPKVQALQKRILAKDPNALPKHGADGHMGPETRGAMERLKIQENIMPQKSLAETMRDLQHKLDNIATNESEGNQPSMDDAPPGAIPATPEQMQLAVDLQTKGGVAKMDANTGRTFMEFPKQGIVVELPSLEICDPNTLEGTGEKFDPVKLGLSENLDESGWGKIFSGIAKLGRSTAVNGRRMVRQNPGKTALGLSGVMGAGGYATGSMDGGSSGNPNPPTAPTAPTAPAGGGGGTTATPTPTAPDTSAADDAEMEALKKQIEAIITKLSTSKNQEIQAGLAAAREKMK